MCSRKKRRCQEEVRGGRRLCIRRKKSTRQIESVLLEEVGMEAGGREEKKRRRKSRRERTKRQEEAMAPLNHAKLVESGECIAPEQLGLLCPGPQQCKGLPRYAQPVPPYVVCHQSFQHRPQQLQLTPHPTQVIMTPGHHQLLL